MVIDPDEERVTRGSVLSPGQPQQPTLILGRITAQGVVETRPYYHDEEAAFASHLLAFGISGGRFRWLAPDGGTVQWSDMPTPNGILSVEEALAHDGIPVAHHVTITGDVIGRPSGLLDQGTQDDK